MFMILCRVLSINSSPSPSSTSSLSILVFHYQTCTLQISLSLFYFTFVSDAFTQMSNSGTLCGLLSLIVFSIAFFNFAGVSITKHMSATTRKVKIENTQITDLSGKRRLLWTLVCYFWSSAATFCNKEKCKEVHKAERTNCLKANVWFGGRIITNQFDLNHL